ncbi:unnamed protein product [Mytilus coruscus]|uniref:CCHC-type domain-containing protein n=1 Tax=Mytilus coruscus TaxID=42192 RepID=A0A6J8BYC1_MYTCO|nr:unnamed protein product [Mytilus coruscus]
MQFEIIAERNNWDPRRQAEEILLVLKDEAAKFASELPYDTRSSFRLLSKDMERRFGDNNLPETYRKELQFTRKNYKESVNEYAARIQTMVRKAYPGMDNQLFNNISIEHMLNGLNDQSIAYDVLTKRPKTMEETISLVAWHTTCKNEMRSKTQIRQIEIEEEETSFDADQSDDIEVRRVGGKRFVTEERLNQFGREMKESITTEVTKSVENIMNTRLTTSNTYQPKKNFKSQNSGWHNKDGNQKQNNTRCYACNEEGQYARSCPNQKQTQGQASDGNPLNC